MNHFIVLKAMVIIYRNLAEKLLNLIGDASFIVLFAVS